MALTKTFEGTWDEIKLHEAEFVGHRLTVTIETGVASDASPFTPQQRAEAFQDWVDKYAVDGVALSDEAISREAMYEEAGMTRGERYKARVLAHSVNGPSLPDEAFTREGIYGDHP